MMTISSAIYNFLLDHASNFQSAGFKKASPTTVQEGDDVHYWFGGATISDMLHACYEQIKTSGNDQRDLISQEISLLHSKNKTNIPQYLSYRDRGTFREAIATRSPNVGAYSDDAINNVYSTFARKICNTRI